MTKQAQLLDAAQNAYMVMKRQISANAPYAQLGPHAWWGDDEHEAFRLLEAALKRFHETSR